jgi:hypothetical protein
VGFGNAIVMADECEEIRKPFEDQHLNLNHYLYIGEVMIEKSYRSKHLLKSALLPYFKRFADEQRCRFFTGMTVQRPDDHPYKPADYQSLEPIWKMFGAKKRDDMAINFEWKQVDSHKEESNKLDVWECNISNIKYHLAWHWLKRKTIGRL